MIRDFVYSLRMLLKRPGFTVAAVAVLSLGIGANTAIFNLVNTFLLKPVAVAHPEQLTGVYSRDAHKPDSYRAFSYPNYADLRASGAAFSSLAAHNVALAGIAEGDTTRRLMADLVSSNYFETLGVSLWRGRPFTAEEERPGSGHPVVIVSYPFWKRHSAQSDIMGGAIEVNGRILTVVGVTPPGFTGTTAIMSAELYLPLGMYEPIANDFVGATRPLAARDNHCLILIGRFRPGIGAAAADGQLAAVAASMERAFPAENKNQSLLVRPLSRLNVSTNPTDDSDMLVPATLLLGMAAVVLLIAALNVANMMLARGTARRKEIAIRLALGGGRRSIVRQLFVEALLLALIGGATGLLFSYVGTGLMASSLPRLIPIEIVLSGQPDVRVVAATILFCLLSTVLFGFLPAWNLSRPNLVSDLRASDNADTPSGKRRLFSRRNLLAVAQVSLSLMLLTAAGLFLRSSSRVAGIDPGFRVEGGIVVEMDASLAGYDEAHGRQEYRAVFDRLRALPGVESAGLAATVPFGIVSNGRTVQALENPGAPPSRPVNCASNAVSEDYFRAMGIPLLRGRSFQAAEAAPASRPVMILDKLAATTLYPHGDALGKHLRLVGEDAKDAGDAEVVGIVGNVSDHVIGKSLRPHVYMPFGQQYTADMHIHLRTAPLSPAASTQFLALVRQEIRNTDSRLPVLGVQTLRDHLDASADYWIIQTGAQMFTIFGGVALLLAVIGLYGVRAYSVARRTREIGIRMALGASAGEARRMVMREGLRLMAVGTGVGLVLSLLLGKVLAGMLFQVSAVDPLVFSVAVLLLGAVSLLACYFPARRASRIDPMIALRYE